MKYRAREGVVLTKLCGMNVLIPTRAVFPYCHSIQQLPLLWAVTFEGLAKGKSLEETIRVHEILTRKSREEILQRLETFYEDLVEKGFAIRCQEEPSDGQNGAEDAPATGESGL